MPHPAGTTTYSHCVVRWEDNNNQYAVVDLKRAKTAVTTFKTGITTLFEGYNRERRRGEVIFLGKFPYYLTEKQYILFLFQILKDFSYISI